MMKSDRIGMCAPSALSGSQTESMLRQENEPEKAYMVIEMSEASELLQKDLLTAPSRLVSCCYYSVLFVLNAAEKAY